MIRNILIGIVLMSLFAGCLKDNNNTCTASSYDSCAVKAPASEIQAVQAYLSSNGIVATQHCSGLFYKIDNPGTGVTPDICSNIAVTYEGRLTSGLVFDQSVNVTTFSLSSLITGWKNGIPYIKPGGRIHLFVPPTLGYGSNANGSIPGNSILVFTIDLVGVQ